MPIKCILHKTLQQSLHNNQSPLTIVWHAEEFEEQN